MKLCNLTYASIFLRTHLLVSFNKGRLLGKFYRNLLEQFFYECLGVELSPMSCREAHNKLFIGCYFVVVCFFSVALFYWGELSCGNYRMVDEHEKWQSNLHLVYGSAGLKTMSADTR